MTDRKVYLVYRPIMDYEESMQPILVAPTRERADAVAEEIRNWCQRQERVEFPNTGDDAADDAAMDEYHAAQERIRNAAWPYGECVKDVLLTDLIYNDRDFDPSSVAVMVLPLIEDESHD